MTASEPVLRVRENCTGCGGCLAACPTGALTLTSEKPGGWGRKWVIITTEKCLGCGACIPVCPRQSLFFD